MKVLITGVLCLNLLCLGESYTILGLFPFPGSSHYVMFEALLKALAEKGHEVDVLSHFPQEEPILRFNDLSMKGSMYISRNNVPASLMREKFEKRMDIMAFMIEHAGVQYCEETFKTTAVKNLKNTKKKYDLIIAEIYSNDCMLGFGYHFKVPIISMTSKVNVPWGSDRFGNPDNPSYIPNYFTPYVGSMSLIQRIDNTISLLLSKIWYSYAERRTTAIARRFFGEDLPDLHKLAYNTSLLFVNSHFSMNGAHPNVPNFVEVGGLHIPQKKPLTKHLENVLNITSKPYYKGVIYLSMGSMILTETLPREILTALFDTFSKLPYQILWKATKTNMPHDMTIPPNIHFEPWMPQIDILCHPNVKLFVTHGGLMGTQEATFCGVPCLGIPLFADQKLNLKSLEAIGLALTLDYDSITGDDILTAANKLLNNPRYKENAEIASRRFKDRPLSPLETAVYWVEYVIRHHGAQHLRSIGADLPLYQYYLLDVCAVLVLGLLAIIYAVYKAMELIVKRLCGFKKTQKRKRE